MEYILPDIEDDFKYDSNKYDYIQLLLKPYDKLTKRDLVNLIYRCGLNRDNMNREIKRNKRVDLYEIYESVRDNNFDKKILRKYKLSKLWN